MTNKMKKMLIGTDIFGTVKNRSWPVRRSGWTKKAKDAEYPISIFVREGHERGQGRVCCM